MYSGVMDYDEKKIFIRSRAAFAITSIIYTLIIIAGLFLQNFVFVGYAQVIISIFIVIAGFFLNLLFGIPGFWISAALSVVQIFIYSSAFSHRRNSDLFMLVGLALLSILINTIFEFFILRVGERIDTLDKKLSDERSRRITYETSAMISKTMSSRPGTIVRHEDIADKSGYAEAVESSRYMALDPLTTLPNRHMINEHADIKILEYKKAFQAASEKEVFCDANPIYAIYLTVSDPVRFSQKNGHIVVDLFIQTMAHRLREAADSKDFVGRIANNEFAIVTTRLKDDTEVLLYAVEIAKALNEESDGSFFAGIAQYPRDAIFAGELIQHAEAAMYDAVNEDTDAKIYEPKEGEGRCSFLEDMTIDEIKKLFDKAFDNDEIYMVYQPRFDADKILTGFESFVRGDCPEHGTVDTRDFLFYVEKTGHIYALGELTLSNAFKTLALINEIDPKLSMTVNLSTTQLHTPDLQVDLLSLAEDAGCNLHNIIIDIPSDGATINLSEIQNTLDAFASSGITMSLDNFGRGYSSLNSIPLLPISLVKLDGHFTADLKEGTAPDVLTHSMISLLKELDIPVDATNVSSEEQFEKLKKYGCTYFQGTYLYEPIPVDLVIDYIKNYSK